MMRLGRTLGVVAFGLGAVTFLAACQSTNTVMPTRAVIQRQPITELSAQCFEQLQVNLTTGQATLVTCDQQMFNLQLNSENLQAMRRSIYNQDWQRHQLADGNNRSATAKPGGTRYVMTLYDGDQPLPLQGVWSVPSPAELPETYRLVTDTFDYLDRTAQVDRYSINLLE